MRKKQTIGAFCEIYGNTIENKILEHLLEVQTLDIAIGDMAKELQVSKPKAYAVIKEFQKKGYVKKTRVIGKTQLYSLDMHNARVQLFLHDFQASLKLVVAEHDTSERHLSGGKNVGVVSAKGW